MTDATRPLDILMPCYEFPPIGGGASHVVKGLAAQLASRGHRVDVVTMSFRGQPRSEVAEGVRIHRVPSLRLRKHFCSVPEAALYVLPARRLLGSLVATKRYDINHTHFILPDGLNALKIKSRTGLRYVITAHGSDVPGYNPDRLGLFHRLMRPAWERITRDAECIVCASQTILDLIARNDASLATRYIPNGIDVDRYDPGKVRRRRILVVTRMLERKGVQHLLAAIEGVRLGYEVHIVGEGPMRSALERLAARTPTTVVFHGWLDNNSREITALYESSEVFVLLSASENFPISLVEAMSAGLAILTSRGTGCEEVIGDAGVLVGPGNVEETRAALLAMLSETDYLRRLGSLARQRVERLFAWPVVADQYLELYWECAAGRANRDRQLHGRRRHRGETPPNRRSGEACRPDLKEVACPGNEAL